MTPLSVPSAEPADPLRQSAQYVKGVGPARLERLRRLGIETVRDLLFHFPRSYDDLTDVRKIAELSPGKLQTARGEVVDMAGRELADGRTVVSIVLYDGNDYLEGAWFNQPFVSERFRYGQWLSFTGKPKRFKNRWQMSNPKSQILSAGAPGESPGIVPNYPLTEDLRADELRSIIRHAVTEFADSLTDILPESTRTRHHFPHAASALRDIHCPVNLDAADAAQRRFRYEELFILQLALALRRRELRHHLRAPLLAVTPTINERIRKRFPYRLTPDQDQAIEDICRDLASARPMQRLLQADVGSGKTAVAVYAMLVAVANQHQAALMAPTETLAQQHWHMLERYLAGSRVRRLLLTGRLTPAQRRDALTRIQECEVDIVLGTQALAEKDVCFGKLGLVVIDEQHRFGVNQRAGLRRPGQDAHYLVMTATPIPRTMALTVFGDLDLSIIREGPPGRQPVQTHCVVDAHRSRVYDRLRAELKTGRQAFIVCPLVSESEKLDVKAAVQCYQELNAGLLASCRLGLLHGGLAASAKEDVMKRFRDRQLDALVTTTVIEVGIDVPNATLMVVEHAERFGLSQLHQLRGRICRGPVSGLAWFIVDRSGDSAHQRLRILTQVSDGFKLAEHDLRLRGPGQFLGTRQHGIVESVLADAARDPALLTKARRDAFALIASDPGLGREEHKLLRGEVWRRYGESLDLSTIG
jgi:ATP-dependent DNA helicase RecG